MLAPSNSRQLCFRKETGAQPTKFAAMGHEPTLPNDTMTFMAIQRTGRTVSETHQLLSLACQRGPRSHHSRSLFVKQRLPV
jgi:hypothetical protein